MPIIYLLGVLAGALLCACAYYFNPLVRYLLIPLTGGTKAPENFGYEKGAIGASKEGFVSPQLFTRFKPSLSIECEESATTLGPGILANTKGIVDSISKVPGQGGWINSSPLDLKELESQGKLIFIVFWSSTNFESMNVLSYAQKLWNRYKEYGLMVIGIHSPQFREGSEPAAVLTALQKAEITCPVLIDGSKLAGKYFGNCLLPTKYLIKPLRGKTSGGKIVYVNSQTFQSEESRLRKHLETLGYALPDFEDTVMVDQLVSSQTLYAGAGCLKKAYGNMQQPIAGKTILFRIPATLPQDTLNLVGLWSTHQEYIQSLAKGKILLYSQSKSPYIIFDKRGDQSVVEVLINGKPVPQELRGPDIRLREDKTVMLIDRLGLYVPLALQICDRPSTITFIVPENTLFYGITLPA